MPITVIDGDMPLSELEERLPFSSPSLSPQVSAFWVHINFGDHKEVLLLKSSKWEWGWHHLACTSHGLLPPLSLWPPTRGHQRGEMFINFPCYTLALMVMTGLTPLGCHFWDRIWRTLDSRHQSQLFPLESISPAWLWATLQSWVWSPTQRAGWTTGCSFLDLCLDVVVAHFCLTEKPGVP